MNNASLPLLEETLVKQVMTSKVEKVAESESIFRAVNQMVERNIGSLAVVSDKEDESDSIIGMLPVYQTLQHLLNPAQGRDVQVKDVMFKEHVTISENATLGAALKQVTSNRTWRLIVLDEAGSPVGVISATDIIKWLVSSLSDDGS
jgi:Predicted transcriptional regulator, contains C-terminal CBS domains